MIVGQFDSFGRPYVVCRLIIPRLQVSRPISFLLDTGADTTSLHPRDARGTGIPFAQLSNKRDSRGIGGSSSYFSEPAILSFSDDAVARIYQVGLLIAEPSDTNEALPSLLGRNVINHWYMQYDFSEDRLEFTVRHADRTLTRST